METEKCFPLFQLKYLLGVGDEDDLINGKTVGMPHLPRLLCEIVFLKSDFAPARELRITPMLKTHYIKLKLKMVPVLWLSVASELPRWHLLTFTNNTFLCPCRISFHLVGHAENAVCSIRGVVWISALITPSPGVGTIDPRGGKAVEGCTSGDPCEGTGSPLSDADHSVTRLPACLSGQESAWQCKRRRRCGFAPWVGKIPWRRKWQPTPVFLPGESHAQRSLVGCSPWGQKKSWTWLTIQQTHIHTHKCHLLYTPAGLYSPCLIP